MTPTKKKTVFLGNFSQKGGRGGSDTWEKFPKNPVFFVGSVPYDYEFFQRSDSVWHHLTMDSFERPRPSREMMGTMTDDVDDAGGWF